MGQHKITLVLTLVALIAAGGAVWLATAIPGSGEQSLVQSPNIVSESAPPSRVSASSSPAPPTPDSPPQPQTPPTPASPPSPPVPPEAPPEPPPTGDWLSPYYGLTSSDDRAAVDALIVLTQSLDFSTFWQQIRPLAEAGNQFAQYLTLAFRDFMILDMALLEFGYVEEPYMNQRRRQQSSPNWLHWLFANWRPDWTPDDQQIRQAFQRALAGDYAAQTLLVSHSQWFRENPDLAANMDELLGRLTGNPYLQVLNLTQLNARLLEQMGDDDAIIAMIDQLQRSRHPLSQWLARQANDSERSPERQRSELLSLAQDGYLTALQEVSRLALNGAGRWTTVDSTPIDMNDAISVYQSMEARQPDNPLVSVALCELYLEAGDYQSSWQYLRKFAYEDAWAEEVEDYSCVAGDHMAYGELMINRGVITEQQWQQHIDTIDARRARIRG